MRLTPPTNATFYLAVALGVVAVVLGLRSGFGTSSYVALLGLVALATGNLFEGI